MKHDVLLFSDHHAHNHSYKSSRLEHHILPGIYNSRLLDACDVLYEIAEYVKDNKIKTVIFAGDLFHVRENVPMDVLSATHAAIRAIANAHEEVDLIMIPGNHDYSDRLGKIHSLKVFKDVSFVTILDKPTSYFQIDKYGDRINFYFVPYSDFKQDYLDAFEGFSTSTDTNVLIAHAGIQGAMVGADYVLIGDNDLSINEIPLDKFDACFFGHYHKHQQLAKNAWYIGATHQHNWGDVGCRRGFLHVTLEDNKAPVIKQIETSAPKFIKINDKDQDTSDIRPCDFVKVMYPMDKKTFEKLPSEHAELVPTQVVNLNTLNDEQIIPEDSLNPYAMVSHWVKNMGKDEESENLGKELLKEAEEKHGT